MSTDAKLVQAPTRASIPGWAVWLTHHWLAVFNVVWGVYVLTPWLAPIFMQVNLTHLGRLIYTIYSTQCHQLPERSYFLFGPQVMYTMSQIQAVWPHTDPATLRQFIGSAAYGFKVAWSDRMVSLYTTIWFMGLVFALTRRRLRPMSLWVAALLILPLALDGTTHMVSDMFGGIAQGFRYDNAWLATLTNHILPAWFYAGDALGSFNWGMRLISGVLGGIAIGWVALTALHISVQQTTDSQEFAGN